MSERVLRSFKRSDVPGQYKVAPDLRYLYAYACIDYGIIISCLYLIFNTPAAYYPLWVVLIAGRLNAFGVILHDLSHLNLKNKKLSYRILEVLIGYPIGTTINAMAYHHLRHHRNTLMADDPYYKINKKCSPLKRILLTFKKGLLFVSFWIVRGFIGSIAYYVPAVRTQYARIFLQDVSGQDLTHHPEVIQCAKEDRYQAFFHTVLILLATQFSVLFYTYYIILPIAGIFCIYRLLVEHEYDIVKDRSVYTMIESTFDHHLSFWGEIFFAPRNIGYHCMHHIHPNVGLHKLPELRQWYLDNCNEYRSRYSEETEDNSSGGLIHQPLGV